MKIARKPLKVAFLSTYPPRECGIASFTQDLIGELKKTHRVSPCVIALSDDDYEYGKDVVLDVHHHDRTSYRHAARMVNAMGRDLLIIEHEYGLFGGEQGENLLAFLEQLEIPVVTTLHTVLPKPEEKQKSVFAHR
jgi:glycosyltransferase involved in cell wall biosynthesis